MASYVVTVADAIKTHINAGAPYSITPISLERRWLPYFERVAIGTATKVVVVPNNATQSLLTRSQRQIDIVVDVFVQKAINWETLAEADAMCVLAEQINDRIHALPSVAFGSNKVSRGQVTFEPLVVGEHMTEFRLWTSRTTSIWVMGA